MRECSIGNLETIENWSGARNHAENGREGFSRGFGDGGSRSNFLQLS